jgi:hypothetical protein
MSHDLLESHPRDIPVEAADEMDSLGQVENVMGVAE